MPDISKRKFIFLVFLLAAGSCKVQRVASVPTNAATLVTQGPLWGAVWQQRASEYKALCYQAYNTARMQLDILLQQSYSKPIALVTDIDETILDNSPYQVHIALKNEEYADASWMEWTKRVDCDTVPGALSFFKYAKSRGVDVFYITNRLEAERDATLKDIQRWGFPDAVNSHLTFKTTTSGKEPRRQTVADTHEIIMLFGDNLSDFSAVFDKQPTDTRNAATRDNAALFGTKFIVLPNAMYGDWEGMLYQYKHTLPPATKDSIIISDLKKY
ncbi:5'-nucleotidase, lipoprotein e(P4) family [Agriterribacter sp.]|uniref:5'-nucleotidase, lipoprotein e(P4) family n=1 Tax=Agriterribacter sp. TaxID=2821509 RepID=UPI002B5C1949|nr:5'-nucleotidase, lipoprotein e(P4) family [Agriterribacter sp.]HRO44422.1 5'-nucleotidase, lipoprotein e(P4) family [Agriterribacter sp.]HRQ19646.1 5'-nucleotidase, lipoprotein e(P4) family [Agriterribacter sp.]